MELLKIIYCEKEINVKGGARIVVTLIHAMINRNAKKGIAAICLAGGEATAIAIERS